MISAAGELAASAARDFIPAAPSASCGSCCINDSPKYRSTAVGIFLPKDVDHGLASVGAQSVEGHDHSLGPRLLARRAIRVRRNQVRRIGPAVAVLSMPVKRMRGAAQPP